jgi:hypothetical protein
LAIELVGFCEAIRRPHNTFDHLRGVLHKEQTHGIERSARGDLMAAKLFNRVGSAPVSHMVFELM